MVASFGNQRLIRTLFLVPNLRFLFAGKDAKVSFLVSPTAAEGRFATSGIMRAECLPLEIQIHGLHQLQ
jgi:hypothetical protein